MNQLRAIYKYLLSFFSSEWGFKDYPLEIWENTNARQDDIKYGARFTNWSTFVAHGSSISEAVENLKNNLKEYAKQNKLPRPGNKVPIQFSESDRIEMNEEIAIEFFDKIIGVNYYDCFVSDYSSLVDFSLDNEETIEKIKTEYGIEPKGDLFLVDIFEQIKNKANA
jgi:predicted RNase H-like HicB family nuclease